MADKKKSFAKIAKLSFLFTEGEQAFYKEKGFTNPNLVQAAQLAEKARKAK